MTICKKCRVETTMQCENCIVTIARGLASDEANRNMRKAKRKKWNREDYDIAGQTFHVAIRAFNTKII